MKAQGPRAAVALLGCSLMAACGGGSPTAPSAPASVTPAGLHPVAGVVYYDENGSGTLDPGEGVRLPGATVLLGGRRAVTGPGGRFEIPDVPAGTAWASFDRATLPPYFRPGTSLPSVAVPPPAGFELAVPAVLGIGSNRPNLYLAFGDSITCGDGSRSGRGYPPVFADLVRERWGRAEVVNDGVWATDSQKGADRLGASLARFRPAYVLVHYGTNDWNSFSCRHAELCHTMPALRSMIRTCRAAGSLPVVGTIIPVNPAHVDRMAEERNAWVAELNGYVRAVAREEGALMADLHAAFVQAAGGDLASLFSDHVHPNDDGYAVMAAAFAEAVTRPGGPHPSASAGPSLLSLNPFRAGPTR